jgi:hypothetical protein
MQEKDRHPTDAPPDIGYDAEELKKFGAKEFIRFLQSMEDNKAMQAFLGLVALGLRNDLKLSVDQQNFLRLLLRTIKEDIDNMTKTERVGSPSEFMAHTAENMIRTINTMN